MPSNAEVRTYGHSYLMLKRRWSRLHIHILVRIRAWFYLCTSSWSAVIFGFRFGRLCWIFICIFFACHFDIYNFNVVLEYFINDNSGQTTTASARTTAIISSTTNTQWRHNCGQIQSKLALTHSTAFPWNLFLSLFLSLFLLLFATFCLDLNALPRHCCVALCVRWVAPATRVSNLSDFYCCAMNLNFTSATCCWEYHDES